MVRQPYHCLWDEVKKIRGPALAGEILGPKFATYSAIEENFAPCFLTAQIVNLLVIPPYLETIYMVVTLSSNSEKDA